MPLIKTVIIEDEPAIRKELEWLVSQEKELNLVATATSVKEALSVIQNIKPDLVLLDIQLSDGTAFDLLNQIGEPTFHIVFVTAYNHFAIKAIKYGALDYLLKPINSEEFAEAIQRLQKQEQTEYNNRINLVKEQSASKAVDMSSGIWITSVDCLQMLRLNEIVYLSGEGSYTQIHLENNKKVTASKPLKYYEDLLPDEFFIRTHQSYIINKNFIDKYLKTGVMVMKNQSEIPVATRRKESILEQLTLLK